MPNNIKLQLDKNELIIMNPNVGGKL